MQSNELMHKAAEVASTPSLDASRGKCLQLREQVDRSVRRPPRHLSFSRLP